jgi:GNAT superfamily N-acetyltransferase
MIVELLPADTARAFRAMRALRPTQTNESAFVARVNDIQRPTGYRLVGAVTEPEGDALAVAGFRVGENLALGRHIYIDDLSTLPEARRHGYGRQLLDWVLGEARREGCEQVHLDSGVGSDRQDAHRLYFNAGFRIASHHFSLSL